MVVDASVMPEIPAANTNVPTIMVAEQVSAFARRKGDEWAIVAAPRLLASFVAEDTLPIGKATAGGVHRRPRRSPVPPLRLGA